MKGLWEDLRIEEAILASNQVFGRSCSSVYLHKNTTCLPFFFTVITTDPDTDVPLVCSRTVVLRSWEVVFFYLDMVFNVLNQKVPSCSDKV